MEWARGWWAKKRNEWERRKRNKNWQIRRKEWTKDTDIMLYSCCWLYELTAKVSLRQMYTVNAFSYTIQSTQSILGLRVRKSVECFLCIVYAADIAHTHKHDNTTNSSPSTTNLCCSCVLLVAFSFLPFAHQLSIVFSYILTIQWKCCVCTNWVSSFFWFDDD